MAVGKPYTSNSLAGNRLEPGGELQPPNERGVSTGQTAGVGGRPWVPSNAIGVRLGLPAPSGQLSPSCPSLRLCGDLERKPILRRVASRGTATCSCLLLSHSEHPQSRMYPLWIQGRWMLCWPQHHSGDLPCASQCHPSLMALLSVKGPGRGRAALLSCFLP